MCGEILLVRIYLNHLRNVILPHMRNDLKHDYVISKAK